MYRNNPPIFSEKPKHAGIQFPHVAQLKETVAKGPGQRAPVILPVTQFCQSGEHRREISRIADLQFVQKFSLHDITAGRRRQSSCLQHIAKHGDGDIRFLWL